MTKWKGQAASVAPALPIATVSVLALSVSLAQAETISTATTAPFVSAVDEDHSITADGSVEVAPLADRAIVEINLADYSGTLSNAGRVASTDVDGRTHVGIAVDGTLSGTVSNSGTVVLQSNGLSSADLRGMDTGVVNGAIVNTGTVQVEANTTSFARSIGIDAEGVAGTVTNAGDIAVSADGSSAIAAGLYVGDTSGTVENTGTVTVSASGTGSSATAYGARLIDVSGAFRNSGTIDVTATAGAEGSAYGVSAFDITGHLENTGTIRVAANAGTNPVAYGINFGTVATGATVSNGGTIEVVAAGTGASTVTAAGINGQTVDGTLSNAGTISVAANGASWVYIDGIALRNVSGTVTNQGTVTLQATGASSAGATGISVRNLTGTLSNAGTITAVANGGSFAGATGLRALTLDADSSLSNAGTITIQAQSANSSASATAVRLFTSDGTLTNSGTLQVGAIGSTARASGLWAVDVGASGLVTNSGNISVSAQGQDGFGSAHGMYAIGAAGTLTNTGTIDVTASGLETLAVGISAGAGEGGPSSRAEGSFVNSGAMNVVATGRDRANAYGIDVGYLDGLIENAGQLNVVASAAGGGLASGLKVQEVTSTGTVINSGDISVAADYSNASLYYAAGIGTGQMDGSILNTGDIRVTSSTAAPDGADAAYLAGIASFDVAGILTHTGSIDVDHAGGASSEAYGIYAATLSGQIDVTGNIAVRGADRNYAIFLGDGAGTLNIGTPAVIEGKIRVSDHDVNLSHQGQSRVYQFEDANTTAGVFATTLDVSNAAWFVSGEGGAAPIYASVSGEDFALNTLTPFELGALSDSLSFEIAEQSNAEVSRGAPFSDLNGAAVQTFARLGYSRSEGQGTAGVQTSNLGFVSVGLVGDAQDVGYGIGLSFASGDAAQGPNVLDTRGVHLSAQVEKDFGFADVSFGIGAGQFDHENRRSIAGSADAVGTFGSNVYSANIGISREFDVSDRMTLTPRGSFRHGMQRIDGYSEFGSLANASFASRDIRFSEAKLGFNLSTDVGSGVLSVSLDAVHRAVSSPDLVDVSIFGSTATLTAGGRKDETFGMLGLAYEASLGNGDVLSFSANSRVGSGSQVQTVSAQYGWEF